MFVIKKEKRITLIKQWFLIHLQLLVKTMEFVLNIHQENNNTLMTKCKHIEQEHLLGTVDYRQQYTSNSSCISIGSNFNGNTIRRNRH